MQDSSLWNAFIVPLLRTVVTGAVWYQGEANAGADGRTYNCSFPALIKDWRAKWHTYTDGATDMAFPFGWAQLNSDNNLTAYNNPNASTGYGDFGEWEPGFPSIRLAQTNALALPNTFQAVIVDTPVASGSVHSPYKQPVGARLARRGLAVAYGATGQGYNDYASNVAVVAHVRAPSSVVVTFKPLGANGKIAAKQGAFGFEVLGEDQIWHSTPIQSHAAQQVAIGPAPLGALAVRYLYYKNPCSLKPYNCPVTYDVGPLGRLTGETEATFPVGPFVMKVTPQ